MTCPFDFRYRNYRWIEKITTRKIMAALYQFPHGAGHLMATLRDPPHAIKTRIKEQLPCCVTLTGFTKLPGQYLPPSVSDGKRHEDLVRRKLFQLCFVWEAHSNHARRSTCFIGINKPSFPRYKFPMSLCVQPKCAATLYLVLICQLFTTNNAHNFSNFDFTIKRYVNRNINPMKSLLFCDFFCCHT